MVGPTRPTRWPAFGRGEAAQECAWGQQTSGRGRRLESELGTLAPHTVARAQASSVSLPTAHDTPGLDTEKLNDSSTRL